MDKHFPEDLKYTKEHEWCRIEGDVATVGITWHAQDALGDIVHCELPGVGETVSAGESFGTVESTKAVSDLYAPLTGEVTERNDDVLEAPENLNDDMYDDGWLIKVKMSNPAEVDALLTRDDYQKFLDELED